MISRKKARRIRGILAAAAILTAVYYIAGFCAAPHESGVIASLSRHRQGPDTSIGAISTEVQAHAKEELSASSMQPLSATKNKTTKADPYSYNSIRSEQLDSDKQHPANTFYGLGQPHRLTDLPPSELRREIEKLPDEAQASALTALRELQFHINDVASLRTDSAGSIYYVCSFNNTHPHHVSPKSESQVQQPNAKHTGIPFDSTHRPLRSIPQKNAPAVPISTPPIFHSRPSSSNVLYLDFNGGIVSGRAWNVSTSTNFVARSSWDCRPYDTDGNENTFSQEEQQSISNIWARVAEDFAPFDVNVTTKEPTTWTDTTGWALITSSVDRNGNNCPHHGYGGIAYVNMFGSADYAFYSPVWVEIMSESSIAEATSHELGHNLGLSHDGTTDKEYYGGHGTGSTSWGPIMGAAYGRNVSTWSKGEYYDANNTQDDLLIISEKIPYIGDDHGNSNGNATPMTVSGTQLSQRGILERNSDTDVFSFPAPEGTVVLRIKPWSSDIDTKGGNLDIAALLYNAAGSLVAFADPIADTDATIETTISEGLHYLHITGTGTGSPMNNPPSGYTEYGSLGQFFVTGTITPKPEPRPTAGIHAITPSSVTQGGGIISFDGSASSATTPDATLSIYRWTSNLNGQLYSGSSSSFSRNSTELSAGQHTITLQVRDSNGLWSENTAQSTLYVYEPGPDAGHDLAIGFIEEIPTTVNPGGDVRVGINVANHGIFSESGFSVIYRLLSATSTVLDEISQHPLVTISAGGNAGLTRVYLDVPSAYNGPATVTIDIITALDENRGNNNATRSFHVGNPPTYETYSGSTWYHVGGDAPATEDGYEVIAQTISGGKVTFLVSKGSFQQTVSLAVGEYAFVDSNRLLLYFQNHINYRIGDRWYDRFSLALLTEDSGAAWVSGETPTVFEGEDGAFNIRYRDSTSGFGYVLSIGYDGPTVSQWPRDTDWLSYTEQRLTLTPSLGSAGVFKFWFANWCWGAQPYVSYTTRSEDAVNFTSSITVLDDLPPETTINSGASGTIYTRDVQFTYGGSDDRTTVGSLAYSYRLVGYQDSWSTYANGTSKAYTDLPNGTYTFEVQAKDNVGQVDPSPAQRTFTVDVQNSPATPVNTNPNHQSNMRGAQDVLLCAAPFSDADPNAFHSASEFIVRADAGNYTTPAWSSNTLGGTTSVAITAGTLAGGNAYWWQCRYRDDTERWSQWSGETSFSVAENHAPNALSQSATIVHDRATTISLPAFDLDGDTITCQIVDAPSHGIAIITNGSSVAIYTPTLSYVGVDFFTYRVSDGLVDSSVATVSVSVINFDPRADSVMAVVRSGARTSVGLPAFDPDGDSLAYAVESGPNHGSVFVDEIASGRVDYQSVPGYNADDALIYSVTDGIASKTGTVTLIVSDPDNMSIQVLQDALGHIAVKHPAIAGYTYIVQYCSILTNGWTDLLSGQVGDGTVWTTLDNTDPFPAFRLYRVIISNP